MKKRFDKIKIQLIFVLALVVLVGGIYLINANREIYDYAHLIRATDYGAGAEWAPLGGVAPLPGADEWQPVADNDTTTLYIDPATSNFAVLDKRNGHVWYSCPPEADADAIANNYEKDVMRSLFGFRYYDEQRRRFSKWSYADAAASGQFTLEAIPDGVRIRYDVGDTSLGLDAWPKFIEESYFQERFVSRLTTTSDIRFLSTRAYLPSRTKEGYVEMPNGLRNNAVNIERMERLYEEIGYTLEELEADNAAAEYEFELEIDFFKAQLELILRGDTLSVNVPLDKFESGADDQLYFIELLKYFGAGAADEDGYMLVPSGSGALIEFNNKKINEETYIDAVYGLDPLMNWLKPQVTTPARMSVLGIKKDRAAMVAWVDDGAAMATVNADISGKNNSYNTAWYTFLVRDNQMLTMAAGSETDMTVVQEKAYAGDLTVNYRFIANENADYTGMALAYQRKLVEDGALTPITDAADTPFYVDIVGAVEKRKFIVGTPYKALETMTTYEQAEEIVDLLNDAGIRNIQMRWMGWFNRGINHDVAKKINWIGKLGGKDDMRQLNSRLRADGGGLYPAVSFQLTSWYSRNFTRSHEVPQDPAGYQGFLSTMSREFLTLIAPTRYDSDWYFIVHPGVLPFHLDSFIPRYDKLGMDTLALNDLGDVLSESIYRKNTVDRESSRMIVREQLARLDASYPALMVAGGNDYALAAADHLVDVPTEMDRYYILDHEVPFYQTVVHGFTDYAGTAVNTREIQDPRLALLNMLATGAAPHYLWSYQPTRMMEFTPYDRFYSSHYANWLSVAAEQYKTYNDIYQDLRAQRITGHQILSESDSRASAVTVTVYENGTRVYVNTTENPYQGDGFTVPALGYHVAKDVK